MDTQRTHGDRHAQPVAWLSVRTALIFITLLLLGACGVPETGQSAARQEETPADVAYPVATPTIVRTPEAGPIAVIFPGGRLGVVVDKNMTVLHVEPGGGADKSGIRVGDVLKRVDDVSFAEDIDSAKDVISDQAARSPEAPLPLTVERAGEEIQLEFIPAIPLPRKETATPVVPPDDYL